MAVDYQQLRNHLRQLLDPAVPTKKLIAIDRNAESLGSLQTDAPVELAGVDSEDVTRGDVVYFEFCLHEMRDPAAALRHARTLAAEIVVFDHLPDSEWTYYGAEEDAVRRSAEAVEHFGVRRARFSAEQRFASFDELLAKVSPQGALAVERTRRFTGETAIVIPMAYELALL